MRMLRVYGAIAGVVAALAFLLVHQLTIAPIWFILPFALLIGGLTGYSLSWSYQTIFDKFGWKNSSKLMGIYILPAILLTAGIIIFVDPIFTIEEANNVEVGALLGIAFAIVIPYSILYGIIQGLVLGGSKDVLLSSVIANATIFIGIGHNLPLFNLVIPDYPGQIIQTQVKAFSFILIMVVMYVLTLHLLVKLRSSESSDIDV